MPNDIKFSVPIDAKIRLLNGLVIIFANLMHVNYYSHRPDTWKFYVTLGILIFGYFLTFIYTKKFALTSQGIYEKNFRKKRFLAWQDIHFAKVTNERKFSLLNNFENTIEIKSYVNFSEPFVISENKVNNFSEYVQAIKQNIAENDVTKFKIPTVENERKFNKISTILLNFSHFFIVTWLLLIWFIDNVHVQSSLALIDANYILPSLIVCILIWLLVTFITRTSVNNQIWSNFIFSIILFIFCLLVSFFSWIKLYNENLIKNNQLPVIKVQASLDFADEYRQRWILFGENDVRFDVSDDWQGINKNLRIEYNKDKQSEQKLIYELPVYQGKFGYYVITSEQFQQVKRIQN